MPEYLKQRELVDSQGLKIISIVFLIFNIRDAFIYLYVLL